MAIDLHIHTIYSDGSETPDEIIMKSSHLEAISITDHDSIEAYHNIDFNKLECKLIPGLEITTFLPYEVHILGYFEKIPDKLFRNELNFNNIQRAKEIFGIVKKSKR
ncbi:MAG: hypothetical protein IJZ44_05420 [Lachnospiraceae bacterium]|nr:hypothetical protein [Lachnospiraceae bacterium]